MTIHSDQLIGKCTYWETGKTATGKRTTTGGRTVACRWVDKVQEIVNEEGHTVTSMAKVYVGEVLQAGGLLARGACADIKAAKVIKKTGTTDNYDGEETLKVVYL